MKISDDNLYEQSGKPIKLTPQQLEEAEIKNQINILVCVMGLPRKQILEEIESNYEGEQKKIAIGHMDETLKSLGDGNRADRKVIRHNRRKNNMTFSQIVKRRLK